MHLLPGLRATSRERSKLRIDEPRFSATPHTALCYLGAQARDMDVTDSCGHTTTPSIGQALRANHHICRLAPTAPLSISAVMKLSFSLVALTMSLSASAGAHHLLLQPRVLTICR